MEAKKGPFGSLISDAISSMDVDGDSQKAVNVRTDSETSFSDRLINADKSVLGRESFNENDGPPENFNNQNPEDYIRWFSELSNKDIQIVGGKGASLGEMFNNKFPVPPGFVVTAQAFDYFVTKEGVKEKIKEIISKVDMEDTSNLTQASKEIRKLIEDLEMPNELRSEIIEAYGILSSEDIDEKGISLDALTILKNAQEPAFVSVRSSATTEDLVDASFAGQQESFLNVKGNDSLVEHVKRCFSSLYTPRAIYYRNKKGFTEGGALLAVVVQKMVDSEKSGVVFSRDPVNLDENVAVEAVFGLGEGIVSGKIRPDHYVVARDLEVKDVKVVNKKIAVVRTGSGQNEIVRLSDEKSKSQVLTRGEIKEIADYAVKLENHYQKPQDIEFAVEGGEIYILQSRPITTLGKKQEISELKGNVVLQGQSASPGVGAGIVKIIKSMEDLPKIKKGDVLVTEMTNPDMVVAMQKSAAIVTDEGGMTSHAAIVSREMGIPCIVGTETATQDLKEGMRITVDGSSGKVFEGEVAESRAVEIKEAVSTDKIKIKVIVDLPDFAERAAKSKLDFVGLTRLEGIIASMKKHPLQYEKEGKLDEYSDVIEEGLSRILKFFKGVWFRASDVRTDEYSSLRGSPEKEINPMLGFHGVRFSLKHPDILKAELEAMRRIARKNPDKKIGIMFPQVITIEEVKEAKKYFNEVKLDNMEFGAMIETPAAVQIIESICELVDFVSFGTNDLTQYTLAVDRNNEDVQYLYNEMHPAIFSQIGKVIEACNEKGVETSICGQAGSKEEMARFLFKKGIKSISVNADAAYDISRLVKSLEEDWSRKEEESRLENERKSEGERIERERVEEEERLRIEDEKRRGEEERDKIISKRVDEEKETLKGEYEKEKEEILEQIAKEKEEFEKEKEELLKKIEEEKKRYEEEMKKIEEKRSEAVDEDLESPSESLEETKGEVEDYTKEAIGITVNEVEDKVKDVGDKMINGKPLKSDERGRKMNSRKYEKYKKWKEKRRQRWLERRNKQEGDVGDDDANISNLKNDETSVKSEDRVRDDLSDTNQIDGVEDKILDNGGQVGGAEELIEEAGEEKESHLWGKKGEVGFGGVEDKKEENKDDREVKKIDRNEQTDVVWEGYEEEKPVESSESSEFLNEEDVKIKAEREGVDASDYQETPGQIEPLDSTERIKDKAEEIQTEVKEDNRENVEEMERVEDRIGSDDEVLIEDDGKIDKDKEEEILEEIEDLNKDIGGSDENEKGNSEEDDEEFGKPEDDESKDSEDGEKEFEVGSSEIEDIGVYNPDEESSSKEDKQKYKYNYDFDGWDY